MHTSQSFQYYWKKSWLLMDNLMRDEPRTGGRGLLKVHSQELMAGVYLRSILRLNTGGRGLLKVHS
jgi:hypothetical protein